MTTEQTGERIPEWTLGDRLRKARTLTGLNTADFAEQIGVSQKTVNNAESDKHGVRKIVLNAYAMATGVPIEWLEDGRAVGVPDPTPPDGPTGSTDGLAELTRRKRNRSQGASLATDEYLAA